MALSARNQFKGKVVSLKGGSVMTEVVIEIGGGHQVVALISTSSAKRLKLKKGAEAVAIIKATDGDDYVTQDLCITSLADEEEHRRDFMGFLREYEKQG